MGAFDIPSGVVLTIWPDLCTFVGEWNPHGAVFSKLI